MKTQFALVLLIAVLCTGCFHHQKQSPVISFDPADWNLEGHPSIRTAHITTGAAPASLRLYAYSNNSWQGEIFLRTIDNKGVSLEIVPKNISLQANQKKDLILLVKADKTVAEKNMTLFFVDQAKSPIAVAKLSFNH